MKHILHDWSDPYVSKILRELRKAASPNSRLYVMDKVLPYTCPPSDLEEREQLPGMEKIELPEPLTVVSGGDGFQYMLSVLVSHVSKLVRPIS